MKVPAPARALAAAITAVALAIGGMLLTAVPASAAPTVFTVTNTNDAGANSLREAITLANANDGQDTINITVGGTISLVTNLDTITDGVSINNTSGATLTIKRTANFALFGVFLDGADVTPDRDFAMSGIILDGSNAAFDSRGVFVNNTVPVRDATFTDMVFQNFKGISGGQGLTIFALAGNFTMTDSNFTFTDSSDAAAAALLIGIAGTVDITRGQFSDNTSQLEGGALLIRNTGAVTVTDTKFLRNSAAVLSGGSMYVENAASLAINGATFSDNKATKGAGGAIYFQAVPGAVTITDTNFTRNSAPDGQGGAIFSPGVVGDFIFTGGKLDSSTAELGGAIYFSSTTARAEFVSTVLVNNHATAGNGGAVYLQSVDSDSVAKIVNTTLIANGATAVPGAPSGGAVHVGSLVGDLQVDSSTFTGNTLSTNGSGLSLGINQLTGTATVSNTTTDEDGAENFFAISVSTGSGPLQILNSTIVGPGALHVVVNTAEIDLYDSIFEGLTAADAVLVDAGNAAFMASSISSTGPNAAYIEDDGGNHFVQDPGLEPLADNGGPTKTRLLTPTSLALNSGDDFGAPAFDQRGPGFARILGGHIDIGAVEMPITLPATGGTINPWIPIGGGILLLLGVGSFLFARINGNAKWSSNHPARDGSGIRRPSKLSNT